MTINPAPLAKLAEVSPPPRPEVEVDDFDLALLRALAADSRQSQRALARQIEMSPPAVADRLARLERSGVIRGYRADIDWAALGLPVVVYLAVTAAAGMDLSEIRRHMTALNGVRDVHELHAWTITSGLPVLSAHVVVDPEYFDDGRCFSMLDRLQDCLRGHFDVEHSTFQLEPAGHAAHERPMHE